MKVNNAKTKLLCISDALSFEARSFILDEQGERLESSEEMKLLGFHLSTRPNVTAHVQALLKRLRIRLWIIRHLREAGFNKEELVRVYKIVVRPVHDYLCVVYHPMLTEDQDERLERIQSQALKSIFGWRIPYAELRRLADVPTLRDWRVELCDSFASKNLVGRFSHWFPLRDSGPGTRRSARGTEKYLELFARCDRLRRSPLFTCGGALTGNRVGKWEFKI